MHFILHCITYKEARKTMFHRAGRDARNLGKLLSTEDLLPHLFGFIKQSGCLSLCVRGHPQLYVPLYIIHILHSFHFTYIHLLLFGYDLTLSCSQQIHSLSHYYWNPPAVTSFLLFYLVFIDCPLSLESLLLLVCRLP